MSLVKLDAAVRGLIREPLGGLECQIWGRADPAEYPGQPALIERTVMHYFMISTSRAWREFSIDDFEGVSWAP